jgi:hypothetical protein
MKRTAARSFQAKCLAVIGEVQAFPRDQGLSLVREVRGEDDADAAGLKWGERLRQGCDCRWVRVADGDG